MDDKTQVVSWVAHPGKRLKGDAGGRLRSFGALVKSDIDTKTTAFSNNGVIKTTAIKSGDVVINEQKRHEKIMFFTRANKCDTDKASLEHVRHDMGYTQLPERSCVRFSPHLNILTKIKITP